jgi:hypothetical protein
MMSIMRAKHGHQCEAASVVHLGVHGPFVGMLSLQLVSDKNSSMSLPSCDEC